MKPSVLIVGLGDLGSVVLELLAREEGIGRIVAAGRNYERGAARCNLARIAAIAQGYNPDITFLTLDLNDKDSAANVISEVSPDILLYTATMQTWWLPNLLPADNADLLKQAGFGMWLPVHLALTIKMMQAVKDADEHGITLIA
ncbi:saccharopine dehydrogenase NADP-binding domain-containing protein, partial [candidate division KSB1 bacterium]|nr:saccharopine dehydrogenase NADP-binding domain-containing protein [candidate division KSB1 bacterium]